jgi:hypothetical protein
MKVVKEFSGKRRKAEGKKQNAAKQNFYTQFVFIIM